jgi:hypothetical protein
LPDVGIVDAEIRVKRPRAVSVQAGPPAPPIDAEHDPRLPPPGSWLERKYKGAEIRVAVVADGFEYEGQGYLSLSGIAKAITDSHINGFKFFRLRGAE